VALVNVRHRKPPLIPTGTGKHRMAPFIPTGTGKHYAKGKEEVVNAS